MGHSQAPTVFACGALADEEKDEIRVYTPYNNFCLADLKEGKNKITLKLLRRTESLKFSLGLRIYDGNHWHRSRWCTDL
mgnify:CR=1 FL=1